MPLVIADRVRETTTTTGTGTITLAGPYTGFQAFSVIGNGNTTYYAIIDAATGAWEVGLGTYTLSGNTLSRDTVLSSSNGGSAVNFSAGTKDAIITQPAARAVYLDSATNATIPGITLSGGTANGVAYLNGSKVLTSGSALTFDGGTFTVAGQSNGANNSMTGARLIVDTQFGIRQRGASAGISGDLYPAQVFSGPLGGPLEVYTASANPLVFGVNTTEQMRLTSTGLGIGTSSPNEKLVVNGAVRASSNAVNVTASAGAVMDYFGGTARFFATDGAVAGQMSLDVSGNLGLGVTPSAGGLSGYRLFEISAGGAALYAGSNQLLIGSNTSWSGGTASYKQSTFASLYNQQSGQHQWFTAPSGTAGNAISFTQAMTLDTSGNLGIGTTTTYGRLTISSGAANDTRLHLQSNTSGGSINSGFLLGLITSEAYAYNYANGPLIFGTNATERARIDSSGNLGLGVTPSAWATYPALQLAGGGVMGAGSELNLSANAYFNAGWKRIAIGAATLYNQAAGVHSWYNAVSSSAGSAISLTQAMTLNASGQLLVGTTSATSYGAYTTPLSIQGTFGSYLELKGNNSQAGILLNINGSTGWFYGPNASGNLRIAPMATIDQTGVTNAKDGAAGLTLDTSSNVGIGTVSTSGARLAVVGGTSSGYMTVGDGTSTMLMGAGASLSSDSSIPYLRSNNSIGFATGGGSERARITSGGRVGLGTTNPGVRLQVIGEAAALVGSTHYYNYIGGSGNAGENILIGYFNGTGFGGMIAGDAVGGSVNNLTFCGYNGSTWAEVMRLRGDGNLLVGTTSIGNYTSRLTLSSDSGTNKWSVGPLVTLGDRFYISASLSGGLYLASTSATSWTSISDERFKENLEPIENAAQKLTQLRAVTGTLVGDSSGVRKPFLIAQDVLNVLPEAVDTATPERLGLSYTDTIPLLVAAIKEQQAIITQLKARLDAANL